MAGRLVLVASRWLIDWGRFPLAFLKVKEKLCKKAEFFKQNKGVKLDLHSPKHSTCIFGGYVIFGEGWGGYDCLELELEK